MDVETIRNLTKMLDKCKNRAIHTYPNRPTVQSGMKVDHILEEFVEKRNEHGFPFGALVAKDV